MKLPLFALTASLASKTTLGFQKPALVRSLPANHRRSAAGRRMVSSSAESSSDASDSLPKFGAASDAFLSDFFTSECDDFNAPPSLSVIKRSIGQLNSGSDIRGRFIDHPRLGNMEQIAQAISKSNFPALTPFAAHCLGFAFASILKEAYPDREEVIICVGRDPRAHGSTLADGFSRGAEGVQNVRVVYTGIATTPAMFEFCRSSLCDGGVMVTASHLPKDRNGMKFFTLQGGFTKLEVQRMITLAQQHAEVWYDMGLIPPTSGPHAVFCSEWVNWMPHYQLQLKNALLKEVNGDHQRHSLSQVLHGLKIVLNAGNGSGGFFEQVLKDLGANVEASIHTKPDPNFPFGVPNPEYAPMIEETTKACVAANADLGIMLDTDADRCGLVAPRSIQSNGSPSNYEPVNRNRLIAIMGVIFSKQSPNCTVVTCSTTSTGLTKFLQDTLGLTHVRYLKGYANVISKARTLSESLTANAEVAIETSGHCALKENDYLDDGTYTAVKVIGLLAKERIADPTKSLLDLIADLQEQDEVCELRMALFDGSLESTHRLFDELVLSIERRCAENAAWTIDKENLEGIRVSTGDDSGFFMLRKSLHDPVLSLQIESASKEIARRVVVEPLLQLLRSEEKMKAAVDFSFLEKY